MVSVAIAVFFSIYPEDEQVAISVRRIFRWKNIEMDALSPELTYG